MRDIVRSAFIGFTRALEGACTWMYLDELGIVTTGYGDALFVTASAIVLPWCRPDGSLATRDEVVAEYNSVLNLKGKRNPRGVLWTQCGGGVFAQLTRLRLHEDGLSSLVKGTLDRDDAALRQRYADFEDWPSCGQLGVISLAWACGSGYVFPRMDAALAIRDFETAAVEIEMTPEHNPGNDLVLRNTANRILMRNAAYVQSRGLDPDLLNWTVDLELSEAITQPELEDPPSDPALDNAASRPTTGPLPK